MVSTNPVSVVRFLPPFPPSIPLFLFFKQSYRPFLFLFHITFTITIIRNFLSLSQLSIPIFINLISPSAKPNLGEP